MPLYTHSLMEIARMLRGKQVKPSEVMQACLDRIKATEPRLNALVALYEEEAMKQALALDGQEPGSGQNLWGVPVTVKDVFCVKGQQASCASKMLKDFVSPYDAFVVDRMKQAGAIIIGRANMDEFAMGSATDLSAYGPTSNPWDLDRVPGGSSGGSAASVAAMQAFASLGSDTGGSVRQPAGLCGCVGLKPTYGRLSRYGVVAYASSFDQVGPIARSVADVYQILSLLAQYDPRDATCTVRPFNGPAVENFPKDLRGTVIGLPKEYWEQGVLSPEVAKACQQAVDSAKELGAEIREVSLPRLPYAVAAYYILTSAEASTNLARFDGVRYGLRAGEEKGLVGMYTTSRSLGFGDEVKRRILLGTYVLSSGYYDAYFKKASQVRRLILQDYQDALKDCHVLMAPVSPITAWKKGEFSSDPLTAYKMDAMTVSLNLAGLPGLSLPAGIGEDSGLPVGIQIQGRSMDEARLCGVGHLLEQRLPKFGMPTALRDL